MLKPALPGILPIIDGGDIDENGQWYGSEMCCLECHETDYLRSQALDEFISLPACGECGELFA